MRRIVADRWLIDALRPCFPPLVVTEFCRLGGVVHIKDLIRLSLPRLEKCHRLCFPTVRFLSELRADDVGAELGQLKVHASLSLYY